jgi:hypothetical protein
VGRGGFYRLQTMPNPHEYDEDAYHEAAAKLHAAIDDLWRAGATAQTIESRIEKGERFPSLRAIRTMVARIGVTPEYLETGRDETTTDRLAAEALRPTDGRLWIVLTREGVTVTCQRAGGRYQLNLSGANLTRASSWCSIGRRSWAEELLRLDVEEERIQARRAEISGELAASE